MLNPKVKKSPIWPALLSALVIPGAGQIFNQEFPKGFLLASAFFGAIIWFSKVVTVHLTNLLPGSPETWVKDQPAFYAAVMSLVAERGTMFMTFQLLLILLWLYSIIDAYVVAKGRAKQVEESTISEN